MDDNSSDLCCTLSWNLFRGHVGHLDDSMKTRSADKKSEMSIFFNNNSWTECFYLTLSLKACVIRVLNTQVTWMDESNHISWKKKKIYSFTCKKSESDQIRQIILLHKIVEGDRK